MKEKKILDSTEEMVDTMVKYGNTPFAIICSRKTFEILAKEIRKLDRFREFDNIIPMQMWFKYDFGDLPVLKFKFCPEDKIHVVDKDTYDRLMWENKEGPFAATTHIDSEALPLDEQKKAKKTKKLKTAIYKRRGLYYDFGKKTIIKRIG